MSKRLLPFIFIVFSGLSQAKTPDVNRLLDKMLTAAKGSNYIATLVISDKNNLLSLMVEHMAASGGKGEIERLVSLQGSKQELILDGSRMLVLLPNGKHNTVLRNPLADTFLNLHRSLSKYDVEFIGTDRVADRKANVLKITAHDEYHYSYKLWLDKKTGIYLRAQWLDNAKRKTAEAMFTAITFTGSEPLPAAEITPEKLFSPLQKPGPNLPHNFKLGWLPPGFILIDKITHPESKQGQMEHLLLGDGMLKVSIYIDQPGEYDIQGFVDLGRTSFYGINIKDKHISVLGELPSATVKRIAESIEYQP